MQHIRLLLCVLILTCLLVMVILSRRIETPRDCAAVALPSPLVVLVLSARQSFERRQVIRETWAKNARVVFVVGNRDCPLVPKYRQDLDCLPLSDTHRPSASEADAHRDDLEQIEQQLDHEQVQFGDLVAVDVVETYRQLPRKLKLAYRWALEEYPRAQWFAKVDDDSIARVDRLEKYLYDLRPETSVIGCVAFKNWVLRVGKWTELEYPGEEYPPFARGSCGHVVTRDVAQMVVDWDGHEYQGEDTSLGIWVDEAQARILGRNVTWVDAPLQFRNTGDCTDPRVLIVGHDISSWQMKECFKVVYR